MHRPGIRYECLNNKNDKKKSREGISFAFLLFSVYICLCVCPDIQRKLLRRLERTVECSTALDRVLTCQVCSRRNSSCVYGRGTWFPGFPFFSLVGISHKTKQTDDRGGQEKRGAEPTDIFDSSFTFLFFSFSVLFVNLLLMAYVWMYVFIHSLDSTTFMES